MSHQNVMDCPGYTYEKLDSMDTDPEMYKKGDDRAVLIEPQTPLVEKHPYTYKKDKKPTKRIRKKKRVLSTLDILISIFVVTPCVVGCCRGLWQILDIYAVYFPVWESYFIGMTTHIVLALGQDVFHQVVVENEFKNPVMRLFALFLMKFYIITFNVIGNMIWRAAWIIFDRYCGLQSSETGTALWEGSSSSIWFTIVCTLVLFCIKGLKNTMSPPFFIALDSKDEVFLFSTRYIYKGTYCLVAVLTQKTQSGEKSTRIAEKLVYSQTRQVENSVKQPPRPFGIKTFGPQPKEFTLTTSTPTPTTLRPPSSMNYPQLSTYRSNYQPKNIQEILSYINRQRSYEVDFQEHSTEKQATNQEGFKQNTNSSFGFASKDPFSPYKPSDPSEVNLLATASFRFAPPVWKNFRKLYQQQQPSQRPTKHAVHQNTQQVETSNVQETIRNFAKPFVVTLNIFPMDDPYPAALHRYGQSISTQRVQGGVPYRSHGDPRARFFGDRGGKVTVKLNVFPESLFPFLGQEEASAESNINKVRFV